MKKHIPNILTLLNLFSGCLAIVFLFHGNANLVPYCIGISLIADLLDGMVARALNVSSPIGKELDSLADMVSFGVLPSMILFWMLSNEAFYTENGTEIGSWFLFGQFSVFLLACFSALRLAKFNIDESQSSEFKGLATPAATAFVVGLLMASQYQSISFEPYLLCIVSVVLSLLLVSNIPMFSFKMDGFSIKKAGWQYLFISLTIIALICFKFVGVSVAVCIYVLLNIVRYFTNKKS